MTRLSAGFARLGTWSFDHRWMVAASCAVILAACGVLATRARFDNSLEAYFDKNDSAYATYLQFRTDFGSDEISYIVYEAPGVRYGPWNIDVMRKIARLTTALENEVPFVDEVTSLSNVEYLEPIPDGLEIHDLLAEFPATQDELLRIRDKLLAKPIYVDSLASRDGKHAAIMLEMTKASTDAVDDIRFDPDGGDGLENLYPQVSYEAIKKVLERPEYAGIVFHHVGDVPLNAIYNEVIQHESTKLGAVTFLVIAVGLLLFLRAAIGVVGPLVVVTLSLMVSLAFIGLVDWRFDLTFIMLPSLLIAVGVADSVHIIIEFRAYHAQLGDRREAARRTLYLIGAPCLLTSLTTAVGFASMSIAPIKSISHFAIYSAVGVVAAFLLSMTLLFVFLSFGRSGSRGPAMPSTGPRAKGGPLVRRGLRWVTDVNIRYTRAILWSFAITCLVALVGALRLRVDSNFLSEFSRHEPVRLATNYVDDVMGGTASFVYLFDTGEQGGIKNPAALREIERFEAEVEKDDEIVRKVTSIVDLMKDINRSFHDGDPAYYRIPESRDLVAQYMLVYEMSGGDELGDYVSDDLARANLEVRVRSTESSRYSRLVSHMNHYLESRPLHASTVVGTGIASLWLELMDYITRSQIRGFLVAFTIIAALMCFIFRSVKVGLIAMVPNLYPVLLTLGTMGWIGMPLDYVRLLIASVAIGISVDDTIHLVTRLAHQFRSAGNYEQAFRAAMADVGGALFITSAVLVMGFLVMLFSTMNSLVTFGSLLAGTIVMALVADFFLMPALVLTLKPFGPERTHERRHASGHRAIG